MSEKLLSVKEVVEWLGVSERTIFTMLERGDLVGVRVGNLWRFEPETIRSYIASHRQGKQPPKEGSPA